MINRVTGTEDHLDLRLRNFITGTLTKQLELHNFQQIQTPILEYTHLFVRSLGQDTDVVSKEMYVFASDQDKSVCLRPEATASTIRACVENRINRFPWRTFLIGPMFRRERPQKGRLRQFTQASIEVIGSKNILQDAHLIKMLDTTFIRGLKIEPYVIHLNFLGCAKDRASHRSTLLAFLNSHAASLCQTCLQRKDTNTLRVFDCKENSCQKLYTTAPTTTDTLCQECAQEWHALQDGLKLLDVNFIIDPKLVRGLDYYHKTVFEFVSQALGAQSTFCGGGRYRLGSEAGAKEDFDCVGAAIGIERLELLLEAQQERLNIQSNQSLTVVMPLAPEQDQLGLIITHHLGVQGLRTEVILEKASVTNMMKKANNMNATFVLILGEDEQRNNIVTVKNMVSGATTAVKQAELVEFLKQT